ncbi:MAG TPA: DNA polymerase III subunit beta [Planctomycetota bacterium]|jgi:DNA polymerase-3 subunit beta|nr:DNA polymerase III subunit beta [Planctomycetota bacterium]
MEVLCDLARLRRVLGLVSHAVPAKSARPILQNVRLTAAGDSLTFEGTDLEVAVRSWHSPAEVRKPGTCLVHARTLADFVRDAEGTEIRLLADGSALQVRAGSDSGSLSTGDEAEFPTLPSFSEEGRIEIEASSLLAMAARTAFAAAKEAGRYAMNGVLLEGDAERLRLVATDGRRLSLTDHPVRTGPAKRRSAILPLRGVEQFRRVAEGMEDRSQTVSLSVSEREVALRAPGCEVFSRVLEGEFPRYASVLPKDPPNAAELDRRVLLNRLKCVSNFAGEDSRSVRLRFSSAGLTLSSKGAAGEGNSEMEARFRGPGSEVAFNPDYIRDALQAAEGTVEGSEVRFEFTDRTSPGKFLFGEDFCYVVMPIAVEG